MQGQKTTPGLVPKFHDGSAVSAVSSVVCSPPVVYLLSLVCFTSVCSGHSVCTPPCDGECLLKRVYGVSRVFECLQATWLVKGMCV